MALKYTQSQFEKLYEKCQKEGKRLKLNKYDLSGLDLSRKNLSFAELNYANLSECNFSHSVLRFAQLRFADLRGANLESANLKTSIMDDSRIENAIVPDTSLEGNITVYKRVYDSFNRSAVISLDVPEKALKTKCLTSRNCRASYVKLKEIIHQKGDEKVFRSWYDSGFFYDFTKKGMVKAHDYNSDIRIDDCPGIHFYLTIQEANAF